MEILLYNKNYLKGIPEMDLIRVRNKRGTRNKLREAS